MFNRIFTVGIVVFWLTMTTMLVKRIHFPETVSRTPVPTTLVIDTFFGQERPGGQFDLFQSSREVGIVTIIPRERKTESGETSREILIWNGGADIRVRWNALVILSQDSKSIAGFDLQASVVGTDFEVEIKARPEAESIDYLIKSKGRTIVDSRNGAQITSTQEQTARALLASWGFMGESESGTQPSGEIQTYEQSIEINGRQREVYTLVASLGPDREITAHFNRSGELMAIYSFLDFELRPAAIILDKE